MNISEIKLAPSGKTICLGFRAADGSPVNVSSVHFNPTVRINGNPAMLTGPIWANDSSLVIYGLDTTVAPGDSVTVDADSGWATLAGSGAAPALSGAVADLSAIARGTSVPDDPDTPRTMTLGVHLDAEMNYGPGPISANSIKRLDLWRQQGSHLPAGGLTLDADGYITHLGANEAVDAWIAYADATQQPENKLWPTVPSGRRWKLMWDGPPGAARILPRSTFATVDELEYPEPGEPTHPEGASAAKFTVDWLGEDVSGLRNATLPAVLASGSWTAGLWAYVQSDTAGTTARIFSTNTLSIWLRKEGTGFRLLLRQQGEDEISMTIQPDVMNPHDRWHHVVCGVDRTGGSGHHFAFLQFGGETPVTAPITDADLSAIDDSWPGDQFNVGFGVTPITAEWQLDHALDGRLDGLGIWNRVLTSEEIAWLRSGNTARSHAELGEAETDGADLLTDLIAYYDFNEGEDFLSDRSGNDHHLADVGEIPVVPAIGYYDPESVPPPESVNDNVARYRISATGGEYSPQFLLRLTQPGVTNLRLYMESGDLNADDGDETYPDDGRVLHPLYLDKVRFASTLRFLNVQGTNSSNAITSSHLRSPTALNVVPAVALSGAIDAIVAGTDCDGYFDLTHGSPWLVHTLEPHGLTTGQIVMFQGLPEIPYTSGDPTSAPDANNWNRLVFVNSATSFTVVAYREGGGTVDGPIWPPSATFNGDRPGGWAVAELLGACDEANADPWLLIPHLADASYIEAMFGEVADWLDTQPPTRKVKVEFTNEPWNAASAFLQGSHFEGMARHLYETEVDTSYWTDADHNFWGARFQFYVERAKEVFVQAQDVLDDAEHGEKLIKVLGGHWANPGNADLVLEAAITRSCPVDAYAVAPYWNGGPNDLALGAIDDSLDHDQRMDVNELYVLHGPASHHTAHNKARIDHHYPGGGVELWTYEHSAEYFGLNTAASDPTDWRDTLGHRSRQVLLDPRMGHLQRFQLRRFQDQGVTHCVNFEGLAGFGFHGIEGGQVQRSTGWALYQHPEMEPGTGRGDDGQHDNLTDIRAGDEPLDVLVSPRAWAMERWLAPPPDNGADPPLASDSPRHSPQRKKNRQRRIPFQSPHRPSNGPKITKGLRRSFR